ncbi:retinol dehydrogenase 7, gene 2 L homeolog isoform X1 [Pelobates cultripes]|uniref:Retinol dehydrogenase 7, gene 2 L homeolog isoform X1 n=1 Tax=Pelobates cultripes TaxID=61616 RepID=A0AAD1R8B6_PELCU|nr:retinol dehydrogenase 7, gene 2 L homeolog isoform X1 [Pelobates cultripes]
MWLLFLVVAFALIILYRWHRQSQILQNLSDKYVFITGCDTGFGNLLAKQLDQRGMRVLAACMTEKGAEDLKKETSSRLQTVILDVTDSQSVSSAAKWVNDCVGKSVNVESRGLWGLVNNAGISIPIAPNEWLTKEDFFRILNVNLLGTVDVTLKMLPLIRKARGRVVNVTSICGRISICGGGYCLSKYAVESFSDSIRRDMMPFGVKVSIVEPGFFKTRVSDASLQKEALTNIWAKATEEVRRSYGQNYYDKYCNTVEQSLEKCSPNLFLVTDCFEHALTAVYPKTRYSAGWDAKLFFIPLSYLPTSMMQFVTVCVGLRVHISACVPFTLKLEGGVVIGVVASICVCGGLTEHSVCLPLLRWHRQNQILPNLSDKYVMITGCDSGFGNLLAKQLDRRGMLVLAACLTEKGAESLKMESSSRLQTVILDVTNSQSVNSAVTWVTGIVGNKGLWGLVNNAGISIPTAPNEWLTKEDFSKVLNVNLLGVVDVTLQMLPLIRKARGRIVNVASVAGRVTFCGGGYCMSKYGVESFSDSLRRDLIAFGVKVCIVEPGFFKTQITDANLQKEFCRKAWARLPEEVRQSYGQQYIEKFCKDGAALSKEQAQMKSNSKLSLVTDCMEHALTAVYPWTRYSAGLDAKILYLPISYFPTMHALGIKMYKGRVRPYGKLLRTCLWGLVNNAGICIPMAANGWLKKDDFVKVLNVNLLGTIDMTLNLLPLIMKAQGRIVNVSSIFGRVSALGGGYTVSKFGVEAFSDSLRRELCDFGVKVSIIEPGAFKTHICGPSAFESLEQIWENLPADTKKSYGEKYYQTFKKMFQVVPDTSSSALYKVTDCMEHALIACYPWTRYSAGWDAKLFFIPLSYLPTCVSDYVMGQRKTPPKKVK